MPVSVGHFSAHKSRRQIAYTAGSKRQHTNIYSHNRWQSARRQCSGYPYSETRSLLHNGSRVCRFQTPLYNAQHRSIFSDPCKIQYSIQAAIFSQDKHIRWRDLRSDDSADRAKNFCRLPSSTAPSKIPRYRYRKNFQFFDQQFYNLRSNRSRSVQTTLAGRIVFQMDKAASPNKIILRNIGECSQITNMDRCFRLRAHRDYKKTTWN